MYFTFSFPSKYAYVLLIRWANPAYWPSCVGVPHSGHDWGIPAIRHEPFHEHCHLHQFLHQQFYPRDRAWVTSPPHLPVVACYLGTLNQNNCHHFHGGSTWSSCCVLPFSVLQNMLFSAALFYQCPCCTDRFLPCTMLWYEGSAEGFWCVWTSPFEKWTLNHLGTPTSWPPELQ